MPNRTSKRQAATVALGQALSDTPTEHSTMIVGYARTSTLEQVAGFEAQQRDLEAAGAEKVFQNKSAAWPLARNSMLHSTSCGKAIPSWSASSTD
jgi:hypothetical protein